MLPANVRLDWKVIARYKHSSLFGLVVSNKEKDIITLRPDPLTSRRSTIDGGGRGRGPWFEAHPVDNVDLENN